MAMSSRPAHMKIKDMSSNGDNARVPISIHGPGHVAYGANLMVSRDDWEIIGKYMKWIPRGLMCPNCNARLEHTGAWPDDDGYANYQCPKCMTIVRMSANTGER